MSTAAASVSATLKRTEIEPDKAVVFASYFAGALETSDLPSLTLERFDVYHNYKTIALGGMGRAYGGVLGESARARANGNADSASSHSIMISEMDEYDAGTKDSTVGCFEAREGEYHAAEVGAGHEAIVIWLRFRLNDELYEFRSVYQYPSNGTPAPNPPVEIAVEKTFDTIAKRIWSEQRV